MRRLVYTGCCVEQFKRIAGHIAPAITNTTNTCHPRIIAACLCAAVVFPHFVKGQCYSLLCNQGVELKLDDQCEGSVNPYFIIANNWSCQGPMVMTYFDASGDTIGHLVNGDYIGQTLTVHVQHTWTGLTCEGSVVVKDKKGPHITVQDTVLNCDGDPGVAALGEPAATDNCSAVASLTHQDSVIDFGCGYTGFDGYFAPDNWSVCLPNTVDGGVDVTGAPETMLVEGASNSPLSLTPRYVTRFKIVIPAEGNVRFDWSSFGGSSFNIDAFYLTINNWCVQLTNDSIQSGSFTTGLLHPGDVLSFEQHSDGNADVVNTLISNFHFQTAARKVIHRYWTAEDESGNTTVKTQVVTIKRALLSQVVFPPDFDGSQMPPLPCTDSPDPATTGQPLIDEDADLSTTSDQFVFGNPECSFALTYEDEVHTFCEGNDLHWRIWTVTDECSGQLLRDTQLIQRLDTIPPQLQCPPMPTVSTDDFSCFGNIQLPPPALAADECSSTVQVTPSWAFGNGYGPFTDIPPGTYPVTYEAVDACGNVAVCQTKIQVQDQVSPTVICDEQTVVSLAGDGLGIVQAQSLDDGTYDFCCVDHYEVKRKSAPSSTFSPALYLDCDDLGGPLLVTLKVTDCAGNYGTCDVQVFVDDQLSPLLSAPADVTLDCHADLSDLSQYGQAQASDNCSFTLSETVQANVTTCGEGTLVRTFSATDQSGNSTAAEQVIYLQNTQPWNAAGDQIAWPPDYTTAACQPDLLPANLPPPYDAPVLSGLNGCAAVSSIYEEEILWLSAGCFKVFRTWKVVDDCQYQGGSQNGIWEYTQTLNVLDAEAPVFTNPPAALHFSPAGNGCTATANLPLPAVTDCDDAPTITASGDLGTGFFFENVVVGTYQMIYVAEDGCGNQAQQLFTVIVADEQPPQTACLTGVVVNLSPDGTAQLNATTLNAGSSDNCTPSGELLVSFSSDPADQTLVLDCDDLGQQPLTIWVADAGGNTAPCQSVILVMDPSGNCSPLPSGLVVAGNIHTPGGEPIGGVAVYLSDSSSPPALTLPGEGSFAFGNIEPGGDLSVSPFRNDDPHNGVSTFDIVKIQQHILGTAPFAHYWQYIAADANGSGTVTTADLVAIRSLILHNVDSFPSGVTSWRFVPADYVFPDPQQPFPIPQVINLNDLTEDHFFVDFIGIKTGDVSGNAVP